MAFAESSFSNATGRWDYDVYLNFRGEDTGNTFTDHLYTALEKKGILTFKDSVTLEMGKHISAEKIKAIETSRISVVVFSKNYASSIHLVLGCACKDFGMPVQIGANSFSGILSCRSG